MNVPAGIGSHQDALVWRGDDWPEIVLFVLDELGRKEFVGLGILEDEGPSEVYLVLDALAESETRTANQQDQQERQGHSTLS